MKVSVSLSVEDVEFLDAYAQEEGFASRSAVLHKAVRLLRAVGLSGDYQDAWKDWGSAGEADLWDATAADGTAT